MVQLAWSGQGGGPAWAGCRVGSGAPDPRSTCNDDNDNDEDDEGQPDLVMGSQVLPGLAW